MPVNLNKKPTLKFDFKDRFFQISQSNYLN